MVKLSDSQLVVRLIRYVKILTFVERNGTENENHLVMPFHVCLIIISERDYFG